MVNSRNLRWLNYNDVDKNIETLTLLLGSFGLKAETDYRFVVFQGISAICIKKKSIKKDLWYTIYPDIDSMKLRVVLNKSTKCGNKNPFLKDKSTGEVLSFGGIDCWYEALKTIYPWRVTKGG